MGPSPQLGRAIQLARERGAEIVLLRVRDAGEGDLPTVLPSDIAVRVSDASGLPANAILQAARSEKVDLIIMGLDPKWRVQGGPIDERDFQRFLPKSTVARVVQEAPCPVWVEAEAAAIQAVVCVLGRRRDCEGLVHHAAELTRGWNAQLVLFHDASSARLGAPGERHHEREVQRNYIEKATREIAELQTRCGTTAFAIVSPGGGASALKRVVAQHGPALIMADRISAR
jgi:hypothetical protein